MYHIILPTIPLLPIAWVCYHLFVVPWLSPLRNLPGPEKPKGLLGLNGHLPQVLNAGISKAVHEDHVKKYGRTFRIKGVGNWEDRILTTDPVAIAHIMKHTLDYEKPWQSRRVITRLIGEGMLAAEGLVHKRMRRVGNPAFSLQNMRALVPVVFWKAQELTAKWTKMIEAQAQEPFAVNEKATETRSTSATLDVCHWISRATFDVIGLAGFDYDFHAIQDQSNELFMSYKDMFEIAVSQGGGIRSILLIYFPWIDRILPNKETYIVKKSQDIIYRFGRKLVQGRKGAIQDGEKNGIGYGGKDLLTLLLKSNLSTDIPPAQRISDDDILHNINTFFFAGSDTSSLALTWTILILAELPQIQTRLRSELLTIPPPPGDVSPSDTTYWNDFWSELDSLPYLNNVVRESLRLIPPVHSSIRVAMKDDELPTMEPVRMRDGTLKLGVQIPKGTLLHVPVESMNLDKSVWGEDAWNFNPDRWEKLPEAVLEQPGLYSNLLTFSAGPRACIGLRFSIIEMKTFIYVLLNSLVFKRTEDKIFKANVVLTRPYVVGKFSEGSQCPLTVSLYKPDDESRES